MTADQPRADAIAELRKAAERALDAEPLGPLPVDPSVCVDPRAILAALAPADPTPHYSDCPAYLGEGPCSCCTCHVRYPDCALHRLAPADPTADLRAAAQVIVDRCIDFFGEDDLDPESSEAMPVVIKNRDVYRLRAALAASTTEDGS